MVGHAATELLVGAQGETLSRPFFPMVRCHYITIEFDEPGNQWNLGFDNVQLPFLMLGLSGVVLAPAEDTQFSHPNLIEGLFNRVETSRGLVNLEDIWIPAELFPTAPEVGSVFRVGIDLFRWLFAFRDSRISREVLERQSRELHNRIRFSAIETKVFQAWSAAVIESAESREPKNPRLRLVSKRDQR